MEKAAALIHVSPPAPAQIQNAMTRSTCFAPQDGKYASISGHVLQD